MQSIVDPPETPTSRTQARAETVGSLLRPGVLLNARARHLRGDLSDIELRKIEDRCIEDAVRKQEDTGLQVITDGEFRREFFHLDFLRQLDGVTVTGNIAASSDAEAKVGFTPPRISITGPLRHTRDIEGDNFAHLRSLTTRTPKVAIPSPTMTHFRGGRGAIDRDAYPELDEFFADLAECFRKEINSLYQRGCRYIQLDDTNLAYLCDPGMRARAKERGEDPEQLPHTYSNLINSVVDGLPEDMTVGIHLCRGNHRSQWFAQGGYEPVAEVLFNEVHVDAYFLEYDDDRSGTFEPLRFVPADKTIVLGLVTTKTSRIESRSEVIQRIREAARYVSLEQLCLSPQCGFASTVLGNEVSEEIQWTKLRLVVETARDVWGE